MQQSTLGSQMPRRIAKRIGQEMCNFYNCHSRSKKSGINQTTGLANDRTGTFVVVKVRQKKRLVKSPQ